MTLEEGLIAHLKATPAVFALLGNRIYHERAPENVVLPALIYQRTGTNRDLTLEGPSSLTTVTLGLDILGSTSAELSAAKLAVIAAVDGVTGNVGGVTVFFMRYSSAADASVFDEDGEHRIASLDIEAMLNEG